MGLLPCILRSSISFVTSSNSALPAADTSTKTVAASNQYIRDRLIWTEYVLVLTMALISVSNALPALVENGFIALLLSVIRTEPTTTRSTLHVYVHGLAIQLLEMSLSGHQLALTVFKDMCGVDALLERLMSELILLGTISDSEDNKDTIGTPRSRGRPRRKRRRLDAPTTPTSATTVDLSSLPEIHISKSACSGSERVLIHSILSSFSLYLQEAGDSRQAQLLRGPIFSTVFSILFRCSSVVSCSIIAPTFAVFGEVINNDPSILSHMLSNGLAAAAIDAIIRDSKVRI